MNKIILCIYKVTNTIINIAYNKLKLGGTMKIIKKKSLQNCNTFSSGIYENCFYKLIDPDLNYIYLYDNCLDYYKNMDMCDSYLAIVIYYNSYLVSKKNIKDRIYKLSNCFIEEDEICLKVPKEYLETIISLAYDHINKKILIATKKYIYSVTLDGYFIKLEFNCLDIFKESEYITEYVRDLNGCCQKIQRQITKCNIQITCVGIFCDNKYIGIIKNNSAYLLELSNNGNVINKYYIDDNIAINSIINNMNLLITKNSKYNYIYYLDNKCNCHYNKKKSKKHHCKKEKCDLIESIAFMETSLAHILNSEGEKLQKILKETNNICEILKTNDSINKTIMNTTMLEQLLYEKLKLICNDCNKCCKPKKQIK